MLYRCESDQANLLVRIDHKNCWIRDSEVDETDAEVPINRDTGFRACAHGREMVIESVAEGHRYTCLLYTSRCV